MENSYGSNCPKFVQCLCCASQHCSYISARFHTSSSQFYRRTQPFISRSQLSATPELPLGSPTRTFSLLSPSAQFSVSSATALVKNGSSSLAHALVLWAALFRALH